LEFSKTRKCNSPLFLNKSEKEVISSQEYAKIASYKFYFFTIKPNYLYLVYLVMTTQQLSNEDIDRIIEMAWEDRTPFDAIKMQFGLSEAQVIALMRQQMKAASFRHWRARVQGRKTKHTKLCSEELSRFKCSRQKAVSNNKISKR